MGKFDGQKPNNRKSATAKILNLSPRCPQKLKAFMAWAMAFVLVVSLMPAPAMAATLGVGAIDDDFNNDDETYVPSPVTYPDKRIYANTKQAMGYLEEYASDIFPYDGWCPTLKSCTNSNPKVAKVTLNKTSWGGYLKIKPLKPGTITLTCTGTGDYDEQLNAKLIITFYSLSLGSKSVSGEHYVMYPGLSAKPALKGVSGVKWTSSDTAVAKVSKAGKITAGKTPGEATIKLSKGNEVLETILVANTYKNAYKAVKNAFADFKKKFKYSQPKRMEKNFRDCSSFVSRCYWDTSASPARRLMVIGNDWNKYWAGTAASQAQWLNSTGRCVAKKAVATSNLLAGDTIHFKTGYAGLNTEYRNIDHVAIYVGGGLYLHTGGFGGKGTIGYGQYWSGNSSVKFIGRPFAAPILNKHKATLTAKLGKSHSTSLKLNFPKGSVKWKSTNSKVAKVSKTGKVTARKAGTATIKAISKGKTYTCKITVK